MKKMFKRKYIFKNKIIKVFSFIFLFSLSLPISLSLVNNENIETKIVNNKNIKTKETSFIGGNISASKPTIYPSNLLLNDLKTLLLSNFLNQAPDTTIDNIVLIDFNFEDKSSGNFNNILGEINGYVTINKWKDSTGIVVENTNQVETGVSFKIVGLNNISNPNIINGKGTQLINTDIKLNIKQLPTEIFDNILSNPDTSKIKNLFYINAGEIFNSTLPPPISDAEGNQQLPNYFVVNPRNIIPDNSNGTIEIQNITINRWYDGYGIINSTEKTFGNILFSGFDKILGDTSIKAQEFIIEPEFAVNYAYQFGIEAIQSYIFLRQNIFFNNSPKLNQSEIIIKNFKFVNLDGSITFDIYLKKYYKDFLIITNPNGFNFGTSIKFNGFKKTLPTDKIGDGSHFLKTSKFEYSQIIEEQDKKDKIIIGILLSKIKDIFKNLAPIDGLSPDKVLKSVPIQVTEKDRKDGTIRINEISLYTYFDTNGNLVSFDSNKPLKFSVNITIDGFRKAIPTLITNAITGTNPLEIRTELSNVSIEQLIKQEGIDGLLKIVKKTIKNTKEVPNNFDIDLTRELNDEDIKNEEKGILTCKIVFKNFINEKYLIVKSGFPSSQFPEGKNIIKFSGFAPNSTNVNINIKNSEEIVKYSLISLSSLIGSMHFIHNAHIYVGN